MLRQISSQVLPADSSGLTPSLRVLQTRAPDDPSIALLDAWAASSDVFTFYQERIANEGFLRTATERRSILELAREVGYELGPGVAATAYVAFTADDGPGAPAVTRVPRGTKIQSVPAPGKLPQTFETETDMDARPDFNAMRLRLTTPALSVAEAAARTATAPVYVQGAGSDLRVGGRVLFVSKTDTGFVLTPKRIVNLIAEPSANRTRLFLETIGNPPPPPGPGGSLLLAMAAPALGTITMTGVTIQNQILGGGMGGEQFRAFVSENNWDQTKLARNVLLVRAAQLLVPPVPGPPTPREGLYSFRTRVAPFGNNAPLRASLPAGKPYPDWDSTEPSITTTSDGTTSLAPTSFYLERVVPEATPGTWVLVENANGGSVYYIRAAVERSVADYALSARVTGLTVGTPDGVGQSGDVTFSDPSDLTSYTIRSTAISAASEVLTLAETPLPESVGNGTAEDLVLHLDTAYSLLQVGQCVLVTGEDAGVPGLTHSEVVQIQALDLDHGYTVITLGSSLVNAYARKTVAINGNVVLATHGETLTEVLGSGDASQPNQRFTLHKSPLTYVPAPTPTGGQSTLSLRVSELLWDEAPSFYSLDARAENYIVRRDHDGTTRIVGGDGNRGARFPTGVENIVATYRTGTEPDGSVTANSLILLKTRPLGIRSVTNPLEATPGQPPETLAAARTGAPRTVLTLDRIVSLEDYKNFASSFGGIGKAEAFLLWVGGNRVLYLAVADSSGSPIDSSSTVLKDLRDAIAKYQDPRQAVLVSTFQRVVFSLSAKVYISPRFVPKEVEAAVQAALTDAFSFDKRAFGQPVTAAEILTQIQGIEGVVSVDLDDLYAVPVPTSPPDASYSSLLKAQGVRVVNGQIAPPELLLLLNASLNILTAEEGQ